MSHQNIRVAVRCRPMNKSEKEKGSINCIDCSRDKITVRERVNSKVFTFDHVFGPHSKQIEVYNTMVAPLIEEILLGYNCTIFAYGQTGSGKTFTMTGERSDKLRYAWENDPLVGIIPRALSHLFATLEKADSDFSVRVSFLEVYNEELFDLLSVTDPSRLTIYDDVNRKGSVIVKGLREVVVLDKDNVHSVIERGLSRRQTASTLLNAQSSRSHSIFTVTVHIKEANPITGEELLRIGKLHLVDLAGSENVGRSGAIEKRAREAGSINQSLLTLGRVITALVDHAPHIPYRESKLTRLLQDSLGGKTKTSIIATIGPSSSYIEETLSTLDYAHRAKNIQNRPEINARLNKTDLVRSYNEELERLRRDLEAARTKTGIFLDEENYKALQGQIVQQRARIGDLEERREILEHDMNQLQEMFSFAQTELAESRECRIQIENELLACQANLEELRTRLIKTRLRLEEEELLRREHQKTEFALREQAEYLLTTSKTAVNDLTSLHNKLENLSVLDSGNRERLSLLPSTWATERLEEPLTELSQLQKKWDDFCQSVRSTLSDLRTKEQQTTAQLIEKQDALRQRFSERVSADWLDVVNKMRDFAKDQAEVSRRCCEQIFFPYCDDLKQLCAVFTGDLESMRHSVQAYDQAFSTLYERIFEAMEQLGQFTVKCAEALIEEKKHHEEAIKKLQSRRLQEDNLIETLRSTLGELADVRSKNDQLMASEFDGIGKRATNLHSAYSENFTQTQALLGMARTEAVDTHTKLTADQKQHLAELNDRIDALSSLHDGLRSGVAVFFEDMSQRALKFSETGLGADLRLRADEWKFGPFHENQDTALSQLHNLVGYTKQEMVKMVDETTKEALKIENMNGDLSYQISVQLAAARDQLTRFPQQLGERLDEELQCYVPTGETPQRQTILLPTQLPGTISHRRLLAQFRSSRQLRGLEEEVLTPLPDNNSSFGDSPQPNGVTEDQRGVTDILDSETDKENRVNSSGLGSEVSGTNIFPLQGSEVSGTNIFPLQDDNKSTPEDTSPECQSDPSTATGPSQPVTPIRPVSHPTKRRKSKRHNHRKGWM